MCIMAQIIVTLLGFALSCVASLLIWWFTTIRFTPNIKLCGEIAKCTQKDNSFKYYLKIINMSRRDAYGIKVTCRLFYKNTYLGIPLPEEIPILTAKNNCNAFDKYGYERLLPFSLMSIKPARIAGFNDRELLEKRENATLSFEDFCVDGTYLEINIMAFDGFSGSRKYMKRIVYNHEDLMQKIKIGFFFEGEDHVRIESNLTSSEEYGDNF